MYNDLTDATIAENKLNESALKLKAAVSAGKLGLWDWDLVANTVYYSEEWKAQIGYEDHEISNDYEEWRSRVSIPTIWMLLW